MEFITGEQFLKESKEVQKVLNDSIKLCVGDRIYNYIDNRYYIFLGKEGRCFRVCDLKNKRIGLFTNDVFIKSLTETDLRQFIEDKTEKLLLTDVYNGKQLYTILLFDKKSEYGSLPKRYRTEETDLLQAYWKVAVQIAKEIVNNK